MHGTSSSQPRFTAWLCLGISESSISSSHLRVLYSSVRRTLGKTEFGADLSLHYPGNSRASTTSVWTDTDNAQHYYPAPVQLILHGWQWLVASGHSQSLLLTVLGKIPPIDLTIATKAQVQEKGILSPLGGRTSNMQLG